MQFYGVLPKCRKQLLSNGFAANFIGIVGELNERGRTQFAGGTSYVADQVHRPRAVALNRCGETLAVLVLKQANAGGVRLFKGASGLSALHVPAHRGGCRKRDRSVDLVPRELSR